MEIIEFHEEFFGREIISKPRHRRQDGNDFIFNLEELIRADELDYEGSGFEETTTIVPTTSQSNNSTDITLETTTQFSNTTQVSDTTTTQDLTTVIDDITDTTTTQITTQAGTTQKTQSDTTVTSANTETSSQLSTTETSTVEVNTSTSSTTQTGSTTQTVDTTQNTSTDSSSSSTTVGSSTLETSTTQQQQTSADSNTTQETNTASTTQNTSQTTSQTSTQTSTQNTQTISQSNTIAPTTSTTSAVTLPPLSVCTDETFADINGVCTQTDTFDGIISIQSTTFATQTCDINTLETQLNNANTQQGDTNILYITVLAIDGDNCRATRNYAPNTTRRKRQTQTNLATLSVETVPSVFSSADELQPIIENLLTRVNSDNTNSGVALSLSTVTQNSCASDSINNCSNLATCTNLDVNATPNFECTCPEYYVDTDTSGLTQNIGRECLHPCDNALDPLDIFNPCTSDEAGQCVNNVCVCNSGYTGFLCQNFPASTAAAIVVAGTSTTTLVISIVAIVVAVICLIALILVIYCKKRNTTPRSANLRNGNTDPDQATLNGTLVRLERAVDNLSGPASDRVEYAQPNIPRTESLTVKSSDLARKVMKQPNSSMTSSGLYELKNSRKSKYEIKNNDPGFDNIISMNNYSEDHEEFEDSVRSRKNNKKSPANSKTSKSSGGQQQRPPIPKRENTNPEYLREDSKIEPFFAYQVKKDVYKTKYNHSPNASPVNSNRNSKDNSVNGQEIDQVDLNFQTKL